MKTILFAVAIAFKLTQASASVLQETTYLNFKYQISNNKTEKEKFIPFSEFEQTLYVDAIWDLLEEGYDESKIELHKANHLFYFTLSERLRLAILKLKFKEASSIDENLILELQNELKKPEPDIKIIYLIAAHEKILLESGHLDLVNLAKIHGAYADVSQQPEVDSEILIEVISDLYFNTPDVTNYMNGEYINSVKIFMFCRQNRLYPCLMVIRDVNGKDLRNENGTLWTNPALASAVTGLPSFQRNGNTPAGIFTIDSVMPAADQQASYGKFRRMMLNFIPKSKDETLIKSLLPKSSWDNDWWQSTVVARDIGRNLFRIHGSGRLNNDPNTPYYPFMRTHGCISQRENTYEGVNFKDQRELLNTVMKAMDLNPTYENEPKIKGILYILELEDKSAPVLIEDLNYYGIR